MRARGQASLLLGLLSLVRQSVQDAAKDPLKDFCRRFDQQTAVIDNKLYIDGGLLNWNPISQNPDNVTNLNLLYGDLNNTQGGMPTIHDTGLVKNSSVPSVAGGILWPDTINKVFYSFGGYFPQLSPVNYALWSYDAIFNQWNVATPSGDTVSYVAHGMGTVVEDRGEGYYLGGYQDNYTTPKWGGPRQYTSNLVKYDMIQNQFTNFSGPDSTPRGEGVMVYLPASDGGLLVYFGGITQYTNNNSLAAVPMTQIGIYDIASGKWYQQTASGQVPENRMRFCGGATWAPDKSSYNIYLYGGLSPDGSNTAFDDVYILTIPAFVWIKWYPTAPGPGSPHHSLSCNVINGAQMIIMGGSFPDSDQCDAPTVYGQHNLNLGKDDPDGAMWALFNPNITAYKVPSEIIAVVGGSSSGGATVKAPVQGSWDNRDLPVYFQRQATVTARTPTRHIPGPTGATTPAPAKKSNKTAIVAGAVVAGVVVVTALLIGAFCILRHRKRNNSKELEGSTPERKYSLKPHQPPPLPPAELSTHHSVSLRDTYKTDGVMVSSSEPYTSPPHSPPTHSHAPSTYTQTSASPVYTQNSKSHSPHPPNASPLSYTRTIPTALSPQSEHIRPEEFYNTGGHSPGHPAGEFRSSPPPQGQGRYMQPQPQQGMGGARHFSDSSNNIGGFSQGPNTFFPPPPPPGTTQLEVQDAIADPRRDPRQGWADERRR